MAEQKKAAAKKEVKAEVPDTPSGLGLKAAEGIKDEAEAAEAYQKAKKEARWG